MSKTNALIVMAVILVGGAIYSASAEQDKFRGIFVISDITVSDDASYEAYRKAVKPVIEGCGGSYVVRAGAKFVSDNPTSGILNSDGEWNPDRIIVLNFDNPEQASNCFSSPEYQAAYALRNGGASGKTLVVRAYRPDN